MSGLRLAHFSGGANDRIRRPIDVIVDCGPVRDRDADRVHVVPTRSSHPAHALFLHKAERFPCGTVWVTTIGHDPHEHLIENDLVQNAHRWLLAHAVGEPARQTATAIDELLETAAAERLKRGVHGETARASG